MVESAREVYASVKVGGKNAGWNDKIKAAVRRKKAAWKVLAASDKEAKERCMEVCREEKRKVKICIFRAKRK